MKAIALISGGLDSILAAKVIKEQGIDIVPLYFKIPFCHSAKKTSSQQADKVSLVKDNLGQDLKSIDIGLEFLKLIEKPKYGFGANMNPCIDCKILMLTKAKELMKLWDAAFVVTGEVLGQRSMSQDRQSLELIERESGLEGLLLRPLSAKLLWQTVPEKESWVNRDKLWNFSGRTRQPQINLAKDFHIENYPNAAGGCLLTDPEFAKRLKDVVSHQELSMDNIELLKIGRHFRISPDTKLIVGRNEEENGQLVKLAKDNDYLFMPGDEIAGPTSLGRGQFSEELTKLSCCITCRYCDLNGETGTEIIYRKIPQKENNILRVSPIKNVELMSLHV